jgi:hypothetical protein
MNVSITHVDDGEHGSKAWTTKVESEQNRCNGYDGSCDPHLDIKDGVFSWANDQAVQPREQK